MNCLIIKQYLIDGEFHFIPFVIVILVIFLSFLVCHREMALCVYFFLFVSFLHNFVARTHYCQLSLSSFHCCSVFLLDFCWLCFCRCCCKRKRLLTQFLFLFILHYVSHDISLKERYVEKEMEGKSDCWCGGKRRAVTAVTVISNGAHKF